jgi:hypothetical protein
MMQSSPSNAFGPLWLQAAMLTGMIFANSKKQKQDTIPFQKK